MSVYEIGKWLICNDGNANLYTSKGFDSVNVSQDLLSRSAKTVDRMQNLFVLIAYLVCYCYNSDKICCGSILF